MFIDADTHVDECEATWSYIPKEHAHLAPRTIAFEPDQIPPWLSPGGMSKSGASRFWFIDGMFFPRRIRDDEETGSTVGTRELTDIPLRLQHMDELDVDIQIIYPTVFISEVTRRPEFETVLAKSYNRWIAERCADSGGRLRWVAVIPFGSEIDAIEEMWFAKEHGAVGVFKRAIQDFRAASDPIFHPAYEVAEDLDLPICIHQSNEWQPVGRALSPVLLGDFDSMQVARSCLALTSQRVSERFPNLRFGFIEAGAAWLPYVLRSGGAVRRGATLADLNFYVAPFVDEDIPYLLENSGSDDNFLIGSDYCHADVAAIKDIHARMQSRTDLTEKTVLKLTSDNVRNFYNLSS
jgi:predicted TIM-barrel fold metal-dependent hydrolase